ncbi:DUF924 domain-containing protein [Rhodanobacter sp. AS-Z3]|uniref:DUF924 family protein n=1 Tax=Rhodanobacter sp. AS-Z3 TaxID=3031330 RepID=UPI002479C125|nr:DUF924 family protein [Rhodanobacter sp. AS-Z3]WEN15975.1 DUF924 domain-containing protein [Rhodanobacter sp. AS-Z3]
MSVTAQDVLAFWFDDENTPHWFAADSAFDARIRQRFGASVVEAFAGKLDGWTATSSGWLALLILLDQFPRNLYRHDPRSWSADAVAQRVALSGLARGDDRQLPAIQRVFAYLPLEHAENHALQQRSVELFEVLSAQAPEDVQAQFAGFLDYARRHRAVIERFGRFPHRNAVLGRASTAEEVAYLAQPGAGF